MRRYFHGRTTFVVLLLATASLCFVDWGLMRGMKWSAMENVTFEACANPWNAYVLLSKSQGSEVKKMLSPIFPCLHLVIGVPKEQIKRENQEFTLAKPSAWDFPDRRILKEAYKLSTYPQREELAVTLGHRRVLESFLREAHGKNAYSVTHEPAALILNDDAQPHSPNSVNDALFEIMDKMKHLDWDFIQLGRCYDIFCHKDMHLFPMAVLKDGTRIQKSKGFELCSHAYLVSKRGAEKIMQYSIPVLLPYDHTLMLLGRTKLLKAYYTDQNLFFQGVATSTNQVCDSFNTSEKFATAMKTYDPVLIKHIQQSPIQELVSVSTRRMQSAKTILAAEKMRLDYLVDLCNSNKTQYCIPVEQLPAQDIRTDCELIGGTKSMVGQADTATQTFLDYMARAHLSGVVIWGLTPEQQHTHVYIHRAIHKSVKAAFEFSSVPMHLCYVQETPAFNLGRDLFNNTNRGPLADSLVFASPKHMMWSRDPGLLMLPLDSSARYLFHGETPRPHTVLKSVGFAIEHEAWGPDGNIPIVDSDFFHRGLTSLNMSGCKVNYNAKRFVCQERRLLVESWASESTPAEIAINKQRITNHVFPSIKQRELHFQGSIWPCNVENFMYFTRACKQSAISVVRHANHIRLLPDVWTLNATEELLGLRNFRMEESSKTLVQILTESNSLYAPSFQGVCHFSSTNSSEWYIADRIFNVIAAGSFPLTNNVAAYELLDNSSAIVYHESAHSLCKSFLEHNATKEDLIHLMDVVANKHTYVSRLSSMLDFIASLPVNGKAISNSVSITLSDQVIKFDTLDTAVLANALDECNYNIQCVLERVPVHPLRNCSQAIFGLNHQIGENVAYTFSGALSCAGIRYFDHMSPELYEQGSPHVHFVRDPLEVVVSGYFEHTESNASWLESSGIKARLKNRSLDKALLMEYKAIAEWNINNSALVYNLKKTQPMAKHDFFTIRVDQLDDERILNVTFQALQKWLGGSQTIPLKALASSERPECGFIRKKVLDQFYAEILKYRDMLEYPRVGREDWIQPPKNRPIQWWPVVVGHVLVLVSLIGLTLCFIMLSQTASAYLRTSKQVRAGKAMGSSVACPNHDLVNRVIVEWSWCTPLFSLEDPILHKDLDLVRTFCPQPFAMTLFFRLSLLLISLHVLWVDMNLFSFPKFYFAFFTHVTHGVTIVYLFVSVCICLRFIHVESKQKKIQLSRLVCVYWGLFAATVTCQCTVSTMYWSINTRYFLYFLPNEFHYSALMIHGVLFVLILLEGRFYGRIPLRAKHVIFPWLISVLYGAWIIFQNSFGPSTPFYYGQDHPCCHPLDDDTVYPQINWKKRPIISTFNWIFVSFLFVPLFFNFLWTIFCWSGRFRFDGSNQHFQKDRLVDDSVKHGLQRAGARKKF